jgi:hypothetical protein
MRILNVHERSYAVNPARLGEILSSLSSANDRLWPCGHWPPMRLDLPLGQGGRGGHGPVRYREESYEPGQRVVFAFETTGLTAGMLGGHEFVILPTASGALLRHRLYASCGFGAWLKWALVVRPLHDALLEDALDKVELDLTSRIAHPARWSCWVKLLRRAATAKQRRGK